MKFVNFDYDQNKHITTEKFHDWLVEQIPEIGSIDIEYKENKEISLLLKDEETVIGRVLGYIDYLTNHLRIEMLFIESNSRGKGMGQTLLQKIEDIAIREGCTTAFVDTANFSAPKFYEKQGYETYGEIKDFPMPGGVYYFMFKNFSTEKKV